MLSAAPPCLIDACYGLGEKKSADQKEGSRGLLIPRISHRSGLPSGVSVRGQEVVGFVYRQSRFVKSE